MFKQNLEHTPIRDFVFPVGAVQDGYYVLHGTSFLIGDRGFAVTAAHVVEQLQLGEPPVALFSDRSGWVAIPVIDAETHPTEDVGILKLAGDEWHSIMQVAPTKEHSSGEYHLWGYPERVAKEVRAFAKSAEEYERIVRPDLVFNKGYIRRRIQGKLPVSVYRGEAFYELSQVAGSCCSGAPVINVRSMRGSHWEVFALYIGEETSSSHAAVGYATRFDAIREWRPKILGTTLHEQPATLR